MTRINKLTAIRLHKYLGETLNKAVQDAATLAAIAMLEELFAADMPHIHCVKLENGMGLLCNNVLQTGSPSETTQRIRVCSTARAITTGLREVKSSFGPGAYWRRPRG